MDSLNYIPEAEHRGIGMENESSLHSSIKSWYYKPGDRFEVKVDRFVADIVRDDMIIEIQTGNFTAIRRKLYYLINNHKVKLVYPIPEEKSIVKLTASGDKVLSHRKSPKKGQYIDLFDELVRIPEIINNDNFILEVLLIKEEDIFRQDGKGSWRRKGSSIVEKNLLNVNGSKEFNEKHDFLMFLPDTLPQVFTNKDHSAAMSCPVSKSQKISYCLKKMGLIKEVGKRGNQLLFEIVSDESS